MASEPVFNFVTVRGNTLPINLTYEDGDGNPINLAGSSAEFVARISKAAGDPAITLTSPGRITLGGIAGTVVLELTPDETKELQEGALNFYELRITDAGGDVTTILKGTIDVKYSAIENWP